MEALAFISVANERAQFLATGKLTATVVRKTWTQFSRRGYKLDNIAEYLGITFQHHDALEDAHAAAQVLLQAIEETGVSVEEWYARTQSGRRPPA